MQSHNSQIDNVNEKEIEFIEIASSATMVNSPPLRLLESPPSLFIKCSLPYNWEHFLPPCFGKCPLSLFIGCIFTLPVFQNFHPPLLLEPPCLLGR